MGSEFYASKNIYCAIDIFAKISIGGFFRAQHLVKETKYDFYRDIFVRQFYLFAGDAHPTLFSMHHT